MANYVSTNKKGIMPIMIPDGAGMVKVPFLVFSPEEIANLRGVMGRSNWCCAATNKMREYLADPDVVEYLETNDG